MRASYILFPNIVEGAAELCGVSFICFWLCWVFVAAWVFSLVAVHGPLIACSGFSCCGAGVVGCVGLAVACGLSSCDSQALGHRLNSCGPRS